MGKSTFYKNCFIVMIILFSVLVSAENNFIPIHDIRHCVGTAKVLVSNGNDSISGMYNINNCNEYKNNLWNCSCGQMSMIYLNTSIIKQEYDVKVQYNVNVTTPSNNTNITPNKTDIINGVTERIYDYNNLAFIPPKKIKPKVKLPPIAESKFVILIIVAIFFLIVFLILGLFYFIFRTGFKDKNRKEYRTKKEDNDEELDSETIDELNNRFNSR